MHRKLLPPPPPTFEPDWCPWATSPAWTCIHPAPRDQEFSDKVHELLAARDALHAAIDMSGADRTTGAPLAAEEIDELAPEWCRHYLESMGLNSIGPVRKLRERLRDTFDERDMTLYSPGVRHNAPESHYELLHRTLEANTERLTRMGVTLVEPKRTWQAPVDAILPPDGRVTTDPSSGNREEDTFKEKDADEEAQERETGSGAADVIQPIRPVNEDVADEDELEEMMATMKADLGVLVEPKAVENVQGMVSGTKGFWLLPRIPLAKSTAVSPPWKVTLEENISDGTGTEDTVEDCNRLPEIPVIDEA